MVQSLLERIKNKIRNYSLILWDRNFKYYDLVTEIKATVRIGKKPSRDKIKIISNIDSMSTFKFDDEFLFYYPGRLNPSALEWSYYEIVKDSNSGHHYEKFGTKVNLGDIVFDCGTCEGFFAYKVKDLAEKIYCFEPNADMAKCLDRTFKDSENVHIVKKSLGARREVIGFVGDSYSGFRRKQDKDTGSLIQEVSCVTLDEFVEHNGVISVDYIKIDVEGSEIDVIKGAERTIAKFKPKIAITTYHKASDACDLTDTILRIVPEYKFKIDGVASRGVFEEEESYNKPRPMMGYFWVEI